MVLPDKQPVMQFYIGLAIMITATILMMLDTIGLQHTHEYCHTHDHDSKAKEEGLEIITRIGHVLPEFGHILRN